MIASLSWNSLSHSYNQSNTSRFPDGEINRGEIVAAIGPSGSGKSTWLQLLSGILKVQNGIVRYGDFEIGGLSEAKRDELRAQNIGLIFQNNHFVEDLSIADNLALPAYALKQSLNSSLIIEYAAKLEVGNLLNKKPRQCSVGELQRLSIIRAISVNPSFILADEPTSALDARNAYRIMDIFEMVSKDLNTGILIVTHDERVTQKFNNVLTFGK